MENSRENSFWKHNSRLVPGRPSPKKENKLLAKSVKAPIGSTSFQDFQNSVRDAWDIGDDEFCIVSEMSSKCDDDDDDDGVAVCFFRLIPFISFAHYTFMFIFMRYTVFFSRTTTRHRLFVCNAKKEIEIN